MAFSLLSTTLIVLATTTAVQSQCSYSGIIGTGPAFTGDDWATVAEKNHNPNATSSVTFEPNWNVANGRSSNLGNWTWRVNVTDIPTSSFRSPVPGSSYGSENYTNPHFVNTVYDLQWPGGGELAPYLYNATHNGSGVSGTLCIAELQLRLPANITNKYQASDNGDCSNTLGSDCVRAYLAAFRNQPGRCGAGPILSTIKECNSTLSVGSCSGSLGYGLGNSTSATVYNGTNASHDSNLTSGAGIYFSSTGQLQGGNNTEYDQQTHRLQAIVLSGAVQPMMLCQRVSNTTSSASSMKGASAGVVALAASALLFSVL